MTDEHLERDGGDWLPGTEWPDRQTPEPPGEFRQDMHTYYPLPEACRCWICWAFKRFRT